MTPRLPSFSMWFVLIDSWPTACGSCPSRVDTGTTSDLQACIGLLTKPETQMVLDHIRQISSTLEGSDSLDYKSESRKKSIEHKYALCSF